MNEKPQSDGSPSPGDQSGPRPKFQFYEIVRVVSNDPELTEIHGERGAILGMSQDDSGEYAYGVFIDRDETCWCIPESELQATGEIAERSAFYDDNTSIRVRVDEQGRGHIVD